MITIIHFVNSDEFSALSTIWSLFGDTAVLILTIYTLHLTAFSRRLELISPSIHFIMFNGTKVTFTVMNKSLHSIPVQKLFILKPYKERFICFNLDDYDPPLSIDSWKIRNLEMQPFTSIIDWPFKDDEGYPDYDAIAEKSIIGIKSGKTIIWIKPYRKAPLRAAKRAYRKHDYDQIMVWRNVEDGEVLSPAVDCKITVIVKDLNGQNVLQSALGISSANGGENLFLNKPVLGHNGFSESGHTSKSITKSISEKLGISKDRVFVKMIHDSLTSAK